jgi:hypothetical protein
MVSRSAIIAGSQPALKLSFNWPGPDLSRPGCHGGCKKLHQKEEVDKFFLAVVARFQAFDKRVPSRTFAGKRPQGAAASKAKSSVLSQLSGLENVLLNDFIGDEPDSEEVSEQRSAASLPDSVPIEAEEERAARERDEMAALDAGIMRQTQL